MNDSTTNQRILAELERLYPDAVPELHFSNPYQTLVATMLSAQSTDRQVNKVITKSGFSHGAGHGRNHAKILYPYAAVGLPAKPPTLSMLPAKSWRI